MNHWILTLFFATVAAVMYAISTPTSSESDEDRKRRATRKQLESPISPPMSSKMATQPSPEWQTPSRNSEPRSRPQHNRSSPAGSFISNDRSQSRHHSQEAKQPLPCTLITNAKQCKVAVRRMSKFEAIAVDCEGTRLSRDGTISLVQIATPDEVCIFDITVGGKDMFDSGGLTRLLEDYSVIKVMHDCRNDSDALYHIADTTLQNVFDTQIAYAILCQNRDHHAFTPLPTGLNTVLKKFANFENMHKDEFKDVMRTNDAFWDTRPILPKALDYARDDVAGLLRAWKRMTKKLDRKQLTTVLTYSKQYIDLYRLSPVRLDTYVNGVPHYGISDLDELADQCRKASSPSNE